MPVFVGESIGEKKKKKNSFGIFEKEKNPKLINYTFNLACAK